MHGDEAGAHRAGTVAAIYKGVRRKNRIDVSEVIDRVGRGAQLVDVLPASIFRQEHLPGALNVPLETMDRAAAHAALDASQPIVVYCFDQH